MAKKDYQQILKEVYDPTNKALKIGFSPAPEGAGPMAAAPADSALGKNQVAFFIDTTAGTNGELKFKVKHADDSTHIGSVGTY